MDAFCSCHHQASYTASTEDDWGSPTMTTWAGGYAAKLQGGFLTAYCQSCDLIKLVLYPSIPFPKPRNRRFFDISTSSSVERSIYVLQDFSSNQLEPAFSLGLSQRETKRITRRAVRAWDTTPILCKPWAGDRMALVKRWSATRSIA